MFRVTGVMACAAMMAAGSAAVSLGATGDVLLEYRSDTGMVPEDFGWEHEGNSLDENCPLNETAPTCEWYGARDREPLDGAADNDGVPSPTDSAQDKDSRGGHVNNTSPPSGTNNNAPAPLFEGIDVNHAINPTGIGGTTTYSEWIEFDDGGTNLVHQETSGGNPTTPRNAGLFAGAPAYDVLRLVAGDGNGTPGSLPASAENNRNRGKIKIKQSHAHNGTVTVVFRGALGPKNTGERTAHFLEIRATLSNGSNGFRYQFFHFSGQVGDVGGPCSSLSNADCGRIGVLGASSAEELVPGLPKIALNDRGDGSAPSTDFFTIRIICDPDAGSAEIFLNEVGPSVTVTNGDLGGFNWVSGSGKELQWGIIQSDNDNTVWVDHVEVLEGAVGVEPCAQFNPVFDQVGGGISGEDPDGAVDQQDFGVFQACATGPTPPAGMFDALSDDCKCLDVTDDEAIDQADFGFFQRCISGTGNPADPACDD